MFRSSVLKNGLTVLFDLNKESVTSLAGFVVASGASLEYNNYPAGISYLAERIILTGSAKYPNPRSLLLAVEAIGGRFYSFSESESIRFYIHAPSRNQYKALSILTDLIQNPLLDNLTVEREKRKIIEEFKYDQISEPDLLSEISMQDTFPGHGLGSIVHGTVDSILSITAEQLQDYISRQFTNNKSFLILTGGWDQKIFMEKVEQEWLHYIPKIKNQLDYPRLDEIIQNQQLQFRYRQRGLSQTFFALNFLIPKINEDGEPISPQVRLRQLAQEAFLSTLLGDGYSSKLWTKTVEEEGLAHFVQVYTCQYQLATLIQVQVICDNSQFTFALESVLAVLESLKKTTISINELAKTKEIVKSGWIMTQEPLLQKAEWQIRHYLLLKNFVNHENMFEFVDEMDGQIIRDMADFIFSPHRLTLTVMGTAKETRLVEKLIKRYLD